MRESPLQVAERLRTASRGLAAAEADATLQRKLVETEAMFQELRHSSPAAVEVAPRNTKKSYKPLAKKETSSRPQSAGPTRRAGPRPRTAPSPSPSPTPAPAPALTVEQQQGRQQQRERSGRALERESAARERELEQQQEQQQQEEQREQQQQEHQQRKQQEQQEQEQQEQQEQREQQQEQEQEQQQQEEHEEGPPPPPWSRTAAVATPRRAVLAWMLEWATPAFKNAVHAPPSGPSLPAPPPPAPRGLSDARGTGC
jgi:hypothetical protein